MMAIDGNIYYDKTLKPQLKQIEDLNEGKEKKTIVCT